MNGNLETLVGRLNKQIRDMLNIQTNGFGKAQTIAGCLDRVMEAIGEKRYEDIPQYIQQVSEAYKECKNGYRGIIVDGLHAPEDECMVIAVRAILNKTEQPLALLMETLRNKQYGDETMAALNAAKNYFPDIVLMERQFVERLDSLKCLLRMYVHHVVKPS